MAQKYKVGETNFSFDIKSSTLMETLENMQKKIFSAVQQYAVTEAPKYKSFMQQNRPWTDRTGAAKQRLDAQVSTPDDKTVRITLSQGVDYGIWLELAHEQKYAIIKPTIQLKGDMVMKDMQRFMDRLSGAYSSSGSKIKNKKEK